MDSNENKNNNQNTRKNDIDEFDNISINYSYKGSRTEQSLKNLSQIYADCSSLFKSTISSFSSSHILPRKCNSLNKNLKFNVNFDFNSIKSIESIKSFGFQYEIQKGNLFIQKSKCRYK